MYHKLEYIHYIVSLSRLFEGCGCGLFTFTATLLVKLLTTWLFILYGSENDYIKFWIIFLLQPCGYGASTSAGCGTTEARPPPLWLRMWWSSHFILIQAAHTTPWVMGTILQVRNRVGREEKNQGMYEWNLMDRGGIRETSNTVIYFWFVFIALICLLSCLQAAQSHHAPYIYFPGAGDNAHLCLHLLLLALLRRPHFGDQRPGK